LSQTKRAYRLSPLWLVAFQEGHEIQQFTLLVWRKAKEMLLNQFGQSHDSLLLSYQSTSLYWDPHIQEYHSIALMIPSNPVSVPEVERGLCFHSYIIKRGGIVIIRFSA